MNPREIKDFPPARHNLLHDEQDLGFCIIEKYYFFIVQSCANYQSIRKIFYFMETLVSQHSVANQLAIDSTM